MARSIRICSSVSLVVAPPATRLAVSDARPSFPCGSAVEPLLIQILKATYGEFGSCSVIGPDGWVEAMGPLLTAIARMAVRADS